MTYCSTFNSKNCSTQVVQNKWFLCIFIGYKKHIDWQQNIILQNAQVAYFSRGRFGTQSGLGRGEFFRNEIALQILAKALIHVRIVLISLK
jgi:hypothetical protein